MKKIYGIIFSTLLVSSLSFADYSLRGAAAHQLYDLIPQNAQLAVQPRAQNMKILAENYYCSQQYTWVSDGDVSEQVSYVCKLPDRGPNGMVNLGDDGAKILFEQLTQKNARQSVKTWRNMSTYTRTLGAISCHELDFLSGKITYKCEIAQ